MFPTRRTFSAVCLFFALLNSSALFGQITINALTEAVPDRSQDLAPIGSGQFTLTVKGSGFSSNSVVKLGSTSLTTTFVDAQTLRASIPAALLRNIGSQNDKESILQQEAVMERRFTRARRTASLNRRTGVRTPAPECLKAARNSYPQLPSTEQLIHWRYRPPGASLELRTNSRIFILGKLQQPTRKMGGLPCEKELCTFSSA